MLLEVGLFFPPKKYKLQLYESMCMFFLRGCVFFVLVPVAIKCVKPRVYKQIAVVMILVSLSIKLKSFIINRRYLHCQGCAVALRTAVL